MPEQVSTSIALVDPMSAPQLSSSQKMPHKKQPTTCDAHIRHSVVIRLTRLTSINKVTTLEASLQGYECPLNAPENIPY